MIGSTLKPLILTLTGDFDVYREAELRELLRPASDADEVILDLSGVGYIDSTALGVLVGVRVQRRKGGLPPIRLVVVSDQVRRIFAVTALDRVWPIHATLDEALAAVPAKR